MRTVNLLVAISMPYLVRLFYEHSTLKLWFKIWLLQGKKSSFQHFLYQVTEIVCCTKMANYIYFRAQLCQKYASHQKKASNKSFSELNFVQKSLQAHMSIYPQSGDRGLERLIWLKYYIALNWRITFNLGLNAAKNTHPIKKASNKSCSELNFVQKSPWAHMSIPPPEWSKGAQKIDMVEILSCTERAKYIKFRALHCQK